MCWFMCKKTTVWTCMDREHVLVGTRNNKKKTTTKWKTQEANLIKKRQFYLVLSKFSLHRSLNDLVILPLRSRRTPSICSAVLSKEIIRQQNILGLKENKKKHPRMETSSDGCDIIYLFIYLSIRFLIGSLSCDCFCTFCPWGQWWHAFKRDNVWNSDGASML